MAVCAFVILIAVIFHYLPFLIKSENAPANTQFKTVWSQPIKRQILSTPVIVGDAIVYGTLDGAVEAISVTNGHPLWSIKLPDAVFSVTRDNQGVVYAGLGLHHSKDALLTAIDPVKGTILWQRNFKGHIEEPVTIDNDHHQLWLGAGPQGLWSVDTKTGKTLWHKKLGHLDSTPLLHKGILYVPAQKSETVLESVFYALNAADGKVLWTLDQPGQPWASPVMDKTGGVILTTTGIGQIGVLKESDKGWAQALSLQGKTLWQKTLPDMPLTPNVYVPEDDIMVYITKKGTIIALHVSSGEHVWETDMGTNLWSEGALVRLFQDKLIAVTSGDGTFHLINAQTGRLVFKKKMGVASNSAPIIYKQIIYVTTAYNITALRGF